MPGDPHMVSDIIYARLLNKPVIVISSEEVRKTSLKGVPKYIRIDPSQLFMKPLRRTSTWGLCHMETGGAFTDEFFIKHFVKSRYPLITLQYSMLVATVQFVRSRVEADIYRFILSFVLPIVYDYEPKAKDDRIVDAVTRYGELALDSLAPGAMVLMETFPFLLQLPSWFPGRDVKEVPFNHVKERMSTGDTAPCLVTDALNGMRLSDEDDVITTAVKEAASIAFGAASETTSSTLLVFLLAMVLHPELQAKAQAEIDRVVGRDRLPNFDDRPALPYVEAILRETLRWHPESRTQQQPVTSIKAISFLKVLLYLQIHGKPALSLYRMFPNDQTFRAMTHDELKYPSPNEFKPERFLHEDGSLTSDTMPLGFSWGRRICVGRHLADASLWIAITSFLAVFSANKALGEHGMDIPVVPKYSTGLIIHPEEFPCRIVPRFPDAFVETLVHLTGLEQL
ncbi:cytochrome P450 [Suillus ampliporus]|nr:cytochrome P450 [Suillus ampliporus]